MTTARRAVTAVLLATSLSLGVGPAAVSDASVQDLDPPVEELTLPVQDLTFGEANADGSLTDLGSEIRVAADVLFAFDKAELSPKAATLIEDAAARITASGATKVTVTGHTDAQGSDSYNLALSTRRAEAVKAALATALGDSVAITAAGRGESDPIADNATKQGQALNRRVEIRLG